MAKSGGLGRGLGALLGESMAEAEGAVAPEAELPLDRVRPNPNQPRTSFDEPALEELTDSVRQNGVLQPILVRRQGDGYEIVAGERRYQASLRAGLTEIPAVVRDLSDDEVFRIALIENLQRADLSPMEEARGYRTLIDSQGLTQGELAKLLSKSRPAIANTLRLLDLPAEVQQLMEDGRLTAGHARAILAVPFEEGRLELAARVVEEGLTVRQTETLASEISGRNDANEGEKASEEAPRARAQREQMPDSYKRAASYLCSALGSRVRVRSVRGKNKIEIEFADEEELASIVERIHAEG